LRWGQVCVEHELAKKTTNFSLSRTTPPTQTGHDRSTTDRLEHGQKGVLRCDKQVGTKPSAKKLAASR